MGAPRVPANKRVQRGRAHCLVRRHARAGKQARASVPSPPIAAPPLQAGRSRAQPCGRRRARRPRTGAGSHEALVRRRPRRRRPDQGAVLNRPGRRRGGRLRRVGRPGRGQPAQHAGGYHPLRPVHQVCARARQLHRSRARKRGFRALDACLRCTLSGSPSGSPVPAQQTQGAEPSPRHPNSHLHALPKHSSQARIAPARAAPAAPAPTAHAGMCTEARPARSRWTPRRCPGRSGCWAWRRCRRGRSAPRWGPSGVGGRAGPLAAHSQTPAGPWLIRPHLHTCQGRPPSAGSTLDAGQAWPCPTATASASPCRTGCSCEPDASGCGATLPAERAWRVAVERACLLSVGASAWRLCTACPSVKDRPPMAGMIVRIQQACFAAPQDRIARRPPWLAPVTPATPAPSAHTLLPPPCSVHAGRLSTARASRTRRCAPARCGDYTRRASCLSAQRHALARAAPAPLNTGAPHHAATPPCALLAATRLLPPARRRRGIARRVPPAAVRGAVQCRGGAGAPRGRRTRGRRGSRGVRARTPRLAEPVRPRPRASAPACRIGAAR